MIGDSSNQSSAYDRLSNTLDQKILDFNLKLVALLCALIWKPLALCTDPFFRKNFGERYLTAASIYISIIFWNIAEKASHTSSYLENPIERFFYILEFPKTAEWIHAHDVSGNVACGVSLAYGFIATTHYLWICRRKAKPGRWYSMSRGESIFGSESKLRDIIIAFLTMIILNVFAPPIGILFFWSRVASFYLTVKQEQSFYNKYLNVIDKRIETEMLQRALDTGEPPRLTDGLYAPLPKSFKGEHRTNVVRLIAPGDDALPPNRPRPARPQSGSESFPAMCKMLYVEGWQRKFAFLAPFKRLITYAVLVAVGIVLCAKAVTHFESASKDARRKANKMARQGVFPKQTLQASQEFPARPQQPSSMPASWSQTQPSQRVSDDTAAAQAALERQRQLEREQAEKARKERIQQIQNTLNAQTETLASFKADCERRFSDNTNKIAELSHSSRNSIGMNNETLRTKAEDFFASEETDLKQFQGQLQQISAIPESSPQQLSDLIQERMGKWQAGHKQIGVYLNDLDSDIANAPKKFRLFR